MKILHFSYTIKGGAGIVVRKFHQLLERNGIESAIINVMDHEPAENIYQVASLRSGTRQFLNKARYWSFRLYVRMRYKKSRYHNFTYNYNYRGITIKELLHTAPFKPDIIFLHWVSDFITPGLLGSIQNAFGCPVIWRYNDLAPATGGCHYLAGCDHYISGCGNCPALGSHNKNDWSNKTWLAKNRALENMNVTVINSTRPTELVFKQAPLFRNKQQRFIRNSLSDSLFFPADKQVYKKSLTIPQGSRLVFWGATHILEPRKGFLSFIEALKILPEEDKASIFLVIAGNKPEPFNHIIPVPHRFTGLLRETDLADHYRASDVVVCTSLEDGGPMLIVESLMCGTPVVSFDAGLAPELVQSHETGYRAATGDIKELAKGITYVLNLPPEEYQAMSARCTDKARSLYGEHIEIAAYKDLFNELILTHEH